MKQKTKRNIGLAVLFLLIFAVLVWLIAAAATNTNAICLFGHGYNEDGKCIRCGEQPAAEPEEQAFVSEPFMLFASAQSLYASAPSGLQPVDLDDYNLQGEMDNGDPMFVVGVPNALSFSSHRRDNNSCAWVVEIIAEGFRIDAYYNTIVLLDDNNNAYLVTNDYVFTEAGTYTFLVLSDEDDYYGVDELVVEFTPIAQLPLPAAPTKTGYTFTGWYTDEACTNKYTAPTVTSDITLYAGFRAHTYSVKFNANTGSGTMANQAMTYDQAKNLTANAFTKEHYAFAGWATSSNGNVVYANQAEVKNLTADDGATIELFAKWQRSEVAVNFVSEGNTTTVWVAIGSSVTLPETNPVKEGHNFAGWYFADGTQYTNQTFSEDTTLTAQFEIIRCRVTFIVDGEVYSVYICDWGTNLSEALNDVDVNPLLMSVEGEYSGNF